MKGNRYSEPDELLTFLIRTRNMLEVESGAAAAQGIHGMVVAAIEDAVLCLNRAIGYHQKSKVQNTHKSKGVPGLGTTLPKLGTG